MVALTESFLAILAYASTIVATLRAGSRALYLLEHDQIGVMDGPLVIGPDDVATSERVLADTEQGEELLVSPLWEVAFAFQLSVKLALDPDFRVPDSGETNSSVHSQVAPLLDLKEEQTTDRAPPYSLSPYPSRTAKMKEDKNETVVSGEDVMTPDAEAFYAEMNALIEHNKTRRTWGLKFSPPQLLDLSISSRVRKIQSTCSVVSRSLSLWARRTWSRTGRVESNDDDALIYDQKINEDEDWDYATCSSSEIPFNSTGTEQRIAHVTAYAPGTFADLRLRFGIPETTFRKSILDSGPFVSFQSNSKGAARVGGIFFFSRDGAYMIKSIKKEEARSFLSMLPKYHKFMRRNARRSLLTRFCGMYGVRLRDSPATQRSVVSSIADRLLSREDEEHIIVVMNAVFPAEASAFISERFDLKGSTVGRECSEEERERKGRNAVLKDLDLAREVELVRSLAKSPSKPPEYGIHIGATAKAALLTQLRRDVRLLMDCNVMDYSLLVGVVNMDPYNIDGASIRALELSKQQESRLREKRHLGKLDRIILSSIAAPLRILSAPPIFLGRKVVSVIEMTLSSILTLPLPYYGADMCEVHGGGLSVLQGKRSGSRAVYYFGLIDFLQPWTTRKVVERKLKGALGYDKRAISCVEPKEYASRFLEFIDAHVS